MHILNQYLTDRDDARARAHAGDDWMLTGLAAEKRLLSFDAWARSQLETRLQWPCSPAAKARLIEQCRVKLEKITLELWRRNWLLDGKRLAAHITSALDSIAARQRTGEIKDFYAYFCRSIETYVGSHAEEIQAETRLKSVGSIAHQVLKQAGVTIPELIAQRRDEINRDKAEQTLRQKLTRQRRAAQEAGQGSLF